MIFSSMDAFSLLWWRYSTTLAHCDAVRGAGIHPISRADMELKFIRDRQRAGIEAAKGKGVYKGRRKSIDDGEVRKLAGEGISKAQIARDLGVSRMTVYRALAGAETEMVVN